MKRVVKKAAPDGIVGLALTWDGARWPVKNLTPKARAFLKGTSQVAPAARQMAQLLASDQVREIRICWVPRLQGGDAVLAEPFQTHAGRRMRFEPIRMVRFGDVLGVIYRRISVVKKRP